MRRDDSSGSARPAVRRAVARKAVLGTAAAALVAGAAIGTVTLFDARAVARGAPQGNLVTRLAQPAGFADLVARVRPAVVLIEVDEKVNAAGAPRGEFQLPFPEGSPFNEFFKRFFEQIPQGAAPGGGSHLHGVGSGFVIDAEGHIVTNNHVVKDADEITVALDGGQRLKAEIVGRDPQTDLAVLKVDAGRDLPYVAFGDSDAVRVGDWAVALGSPFGLGGSVSAGIISARGRDIDAGPYDDFFQIDTPINRGNSGGPLFDATGQVIGVNTAIFSPNGGNIGIGFAIPSKLARQVVSQLIATGKVERGYLGVHIQPVTKEIAEAVGLKDAKGALVASVMAGSPASKAGIKQGDVITRLDDEAIDNAKDLARTVGRHGGGKRVALVLWRNGKEKRLSVDLAKTPDLKVAAAPAKAETGKLGLTVAPIGPDDRTRLGLDEDVTGVVVVDVDRSGPAAEAGLRRGDVIKAVDNDHVSGPADVAKRVDAAVKDGRKAVLLLVNRAGDDRFVAVALRDA